MVGNENELILLYSFLVEYICSSCIFVLMLRFVVKWVGLGGTNFVHVCKNIMALPIFLEWLKFSVCLIFSSRPKDISCPWQHRWGIHLNCYTKIYSEFHFICRSLFPACVICWYCDNLMCKPRFMWGMLWDFQSMV